MNKGRPPARAGLSQKTASGDGWLKDSSEFKDELETCVGGARNHVFVATAYLTRLGTEWLVAHTATVASVTIVVRWNLADLLSGSSDLESYTIARRHGWSFRAMQDLHAKIWLVDKQALFVGSANATARGLSLVESGNREFGVRVVARPLDVEVIDKLATDSILITDELFQRISQAIKNCAGSNDDTPTVWPPALAQILMRPTEMSPLWVAECLQTDGTWLSSADNIAKNLKPDELCDLSLLGVSAEVLLAPERKALLTSALRGAKMYRWLTSLLARQDTREAFFGSLSAALHDSLANDPKPYRQTVKELLSNLLGWIAVLEIPDVHIDTPKYSQRVALASSAGNT